VILVIAVTIVGDLHLMVVTTVVVRGREALVPIMVVGEVAVAVVVEGVEVGAVVADAVDGN
jgi:hypothetical protein